MPEVQVNRAAQLSRGHLLASNVVWNLVGNGTPMAVAVFSIPILIRELGKDRFGVLALAWALVGYASLFDLGLGRALTQLVARKLGEEDDTELHALVWTSLLLMLCLGLFGGLAAATISPLLVHEALSVPVELQTEMLHSFYLLALSIPVVITVAGLRGLLEAHQRFRLLNALRIPMGIYSFAAPLAVLPFSHSLVPVVAVLIAGRFVGWILHALLCLRILPSLKQRIVWHSGMAGALLRFGGWMTVSNVISPLMVSLDRFVVGALLSMTAVAYYATPYEVVTKFIFVPGAIVAVMFPAFSAGFVHDQRHAVLLYRRCLKYLFMILFPVVLLTIGFAQMGLTMWLGADFAQHSVSVLQWLAAGVLMNCLAQVPLAFVQGGGRPDLTAKLHMMELPCYLLVLWGLTSTYGIEGAAIAWTARCTLDAIVLFALASRLLPSAALFSSRNLLGSAVVLVTLTMAAVTCSVVVKAVLLGAVIFLFVTISWFRLLSPDERALVRTVA